MKVGISKSTAELCLLGKVFAAVHEVDSLNGYMIAYTQEDDHVGYIVECSEGSFLLTKELVHEKIEVLGEL